MVAIYGLTYALFIASCGRLGDRYGRKKLFLLGIGGFAVASVICGASQNITTMLFGRLLQGFFGALLTPQILATIHATLKGDAHSRAIGIYAAVGGLSFVVGQVLGGLLVSANLFDLGWRNAFFVNIPICVLLLILGIQQIPETRAPNFPKMDIAGIILLAGTLLSLLIPIVLGSHWPILWWILLLLPIFCLALWKVENFKESKNLQPLLPTFFFKDFAIRLGFVCQSVAVLYSTGFVFVVALYLQKILKFTPFQSGVSFLSMGICYFIGSLLSKLLKKSIGDIKCFFFGACLNILGTAGLFCLFWYFKLSIGIIEIQIPTILIGIGSSFMLTSAYRITLEKVKKELAGEASSAIITLQQVVAVLGTAVVGVIYAVSFSVFDNPLTALAYALVFCSLVVILDCIFLFLGRKHLSNNQDIIHDISN